MLDISHVEAPWLRDLELENGASIVVIGAYKGDTIEFLLEHHPTANITAFEPQEWAYNELCSKFVNCERVTLYKHALGLGTVAEFPMHEYGTDAASLLEVKNSRAMQKVSVLDAHILKDWQKIDLCVVNIEGFEYYLIPYILDLEIRPVNWLIQFHHPARFSNEYLDLHGKFVDCGYTSGELLGSGWKAWQK